MTEVPYNNNIQAYNVAQFIKSGCAEITFINNTDPLTGSNLVLNGSLILTPGQSIGFDGKQFERDLTTYNINFVGGSVNNCVVIRKFYNQ